MHYTDFDAYHHKGNVNQGGPDLTVTSNSKPIPIKMQITNIRKKQL